MFGSIVEDSVTSSSCEYKSCLYSSVVEVHSQKRVTMSNFNGGLEHVLQYYEDPEDALCIVEGYENTSLMTYPPLGRLEDFITREGLSRLKRHGLRQATHVVSFHQEQMMVGALYTSLIPDVLTRPQADANGILPVDWHDLPPRAKWAVYYLVQIYLPVFCGQVTAAVARWDGRNCGRNRTEPVTLLPETIFPLFGCHDNIFPASSGSIVSINGHEVLEYNNFYTRTSGAVAHQFEISKKEANLEHEHFDDEEQSDYEVPCAKTTKRKRVAISKSTNDSESDDEYEPNRAKRLRSTSEFSDTSSIESEDEVLIESIESDVPLKNQGPPVAPDVRDKDCEGHEPPVTQTEVTIASSGGPCSSTDKASLLSEMTSKSLDAKNSRLRDTFSSPKELRARNNKTCPKKNKPKPSGGSKKGTPRGRIIKTELLVDQSNSPPYSNTKQASKKKRQSGTPPNRSGSWTLVESEALYRALLHQRQVETDKKQRPLQDIALWRAVSDILVAQNIQRGHGACKNQWNRFGRAQYRFDERRTRRTESLVTSSQGSNSRRR